MRFLLVFLTLCIAVKANSQSSQNEFTWPDGQKIAVSLSYDDALNSQLDNAVPTLNKYHLKASFYLIPTISMTVRDRLPEWREVAAMGHELGNHSIYHPCSASLPDREWVNSYKNIDNYTVEQMREELITANTILYAIDGKSERTFTPPCGDFITSGENYIPSIVDLFVAIKGQGMQDGFADLWGVSDVSGQDLIDYVENVGGKTKMVNILFHGIGGDHSSVSKEAHDVFIKYLAENSDKYWVDSYINIMKYVKENRK